MRKQVFIEYDASKEAPEVTQTVEVALEEAPVVTQTVEIAVEEAPVATQTVEVAVEEAPEVTQTVEITVEKVSDVTQAIEIAVEEKPEITPAVEVGVEEGTEEPEVTAILEVAVEEIPEVTPTVDVVVEEAPDEPETCMRKHKYNILPEMTADEYAALKASIQKNGYDKLNFPIVVSAKGSGDVIIDGWNRYKACQELNIEFSYKLFEHSDEEVLEYVMRTNTRRNLTPEQWAVLAVQNEEILQTLRKQVEATTAEKMLAGKSDPTTSVSKVKKDKNKCTTKALVAKKVNTTPKLLASVENLKEENPEEFPKMAVDILKGETTIRKIKAGKKRAAALETKAVSINVVPSPIENQDKEDTGNEMTDTEILQMVKNVRAEVKGIERLIIDSGLENEFIEMNLQHLKAIEKLQLVLGIRLTGFKKQNYESLTTTKTQDESSIETTQARLSSCLVASEC